MREHITHVAFDMHQASITAAWLLPGASSPELRTIPHEPKPFRRLVKEILTQGPACACYEAGPLGYAPQRQLEAWGLPCAVIAPSLIPRRPGQRIKTDKRDATKLVGRSRAGELTAIRIPTPAEEDVRELVRCREACGTDALRAQQRLRTFLLRRGLRSPDGPAGSQAWWVWVQALRLPDPAAQRTLDEYCLAATTLRARWKALDPEEWGTLPCCARCDTALGVAGSVWLWTPRPLTRLQRPGTAATRSGGTTMLWRASLPPPARGAAGRRQNQDATWQRSHTGIAGPGGEEATTTCTTWQRPPLFHDSRAFIHKIRELCF